MASSKEKENLSYKMAHTMKVISWMVNSMATEFNTSRVSKKPIQVVSSMVKWKEREKNNGQMAENTMEPSETIKNMDKVLSNMPMETSTSETSKKARWTATPFS